MEHLYALLKLCQQRGVQEVYVHAFLMGRMLILKVPGFCCCSGKEDAGIGHWKNCLVAGRYYAMDRDNHWDRIEKAYNALVLGEGLRPLMLMLL